MRLPFFIRRKYNASQHASSKPLAFHSLFLLSCFESPEISRLCMENMVGAANQFFLLNIILFYSSFPQNLKIQC